MIFIVLYRKAVEIMNIKLYQFNEVIAMKKKNLFFVVFIFLFLFLAVPTKAEAKKKIPFLKIGSEPWTIKKKNTIFLKKGKHVNLKKCVKDWEKYTRDGWRGDVYWHVSMEGLGQIQEDKPGIVVGLKTGEVFLFIMKLKKNGSDIKTKVIRFVITDKKTKYYKDFLYEKSGKNIRIVRYVGNAKTVKIPPKIKGKNVTTLGEDSFRRNDYLKKLSMPTSVTSVLDRGLSNNALEEIIAPGLIDFEKIGGKNTKKIIISENIKKLNYEAFSGCKKLESISDMSQLESIDDRAFFHCYKLGKISDMPQLESIGNMAFSGCKKIKSFYFGSKLRKIGEYSFEKCKSLSRIELPDNVEMVGDDAFRECSKLREVKLNDKLQTIPESCFGECKKLKTIILPKETLKEIGKCAFTGTAIKEMRIPDGVVAIEESAFSYCKQLENVWIPDSVLELYLYKGDMSILAWGEVEFDEVPLARDKLSISGRYDVPIFYNSYNVTVHFGPSWKDRLPSRYRLSANEGVKEIVVEQN